MRSPLRYVKSFRPSPLLSLDTPTCVIGTENIMFSLCLDGLARGLVITRAVRRAADGHPVRTNTQYERRNINAASRTAAVGRHFSIHPVEKVTDDGPAGLSLHGVLAENPVIVERDDGAIAPL